MNQDTNIDKKIRLIRFLLLSFFLFTVCDVTGRMFVPQGVEISGFRRMAFWAIALALGAVFFYGNRAIKKPALKIAGAALVFVVYMLLLGMTHFYRFGGAEMVGYKIGASILPVAAAFWCAFALKIYRRYCVLVKRLLKIDNTENILFLLSQALLAVVIGVVIWGAYQLDGIFGQKSIDIQQKVEEGEVNHNTDHKEPFRHYDRIFNDLQDVQIKAAMKNGLSGPITKEQAENSRQLVPIETCKYYSVDKLTHSIPYLVPSAAQLVEDMGKAFQDSLYNRGYNRNHKFIVTSVLRTEETVKQLRRTNGNATENSCHCYGTTVDIAYFRYDVPETGTVAEQEKLRQILFQVAYDMRNAGRCYVKYEKQQSCLHITVR